MSEKDGLRERCHCSHDKSTHHEGKHNCLGMYCDCKAYVNEWEKLPPKAPPKPKSEPPPDDDVDNGWIAPATNWPKFWP